MRRNAMSAPARASHEASRLAVSRGEAGTLAAVAVLLVPLLMLVGGVFSLPSLLERGFASLSPKHSDGAAESGLAAPARLSRAIQPRPQGGQVAPPRTSHRSSLGAVSVAVATTPPAPTRGGTRSTPATEPGATDAPATGGSGSASPEVPTTGTEAGSGGLPEPVGPGPVATRPPAVTIGVNETTATVGVDTGPAPVPASATVSVAPTGVTAEVNAAGAAVSASTTVATAVAELSPPAVTSVADPLVSTAVTLLGG